MKQQMTPEELHTFFDKASPAEINAYHEQNAPAEQEAQPESQETPVEAAPVEEALQPVQEPTETSQQRNFRELRESYLRAQWERDEMARQLAELKQKPVHASAPAEDEPDIDISDDHLIEGKDLKKIVSKIEKKVESRVKREFQQQQRVTQQQLTENRLRMELPDLDKVVSAKNLETLSREYPELAASVQSANDLYVQAKSAYTLIKKLGIVPVQQNDNAQRIQQNMAKPKAVQTAGGKQSALVDVSNYDGNLTDDMKREIWADMQRYSR